jgi:hypothetical protein
MQARCASSPAAQLQVCANCLQGRNNPTNLRTPRCCDAPVLYTYRIEPNQPGFIPPPHAPDESRQLRLPEVESRVERCLWCDGLHAGGPEWCKDNEW